MLGVLHEKPSLDAVSVHWENVLGVEQSLVGELFSAVSAHTDTQTEPSPKITAMDAHHIFLSPTDKAQLTTVDSREHRMV